MLPTPTLCFRYFSVYTSLGPWSAHEGLHSKHKTRRAAVPIAIVAAAYLYLAKCIKFPKGVFTPFNNSLCLIFVYLAITEVSDAIKNCKNLIVLDISLNELVKVQEGVSQLVNLEQLLLNDDCLEFLHANVGRLTKVRVLELRENQLQTLPKSLSRLTHLTRLDLSANDLPEIVSLLPSKYSECVVSSQIDFFVIACLVTFASRFLLCLSFAK